MPISLQQQLAQIAQNSTHQLDLKAQKIGHSKSLLFDPKVAARQDYNTIFQICIEGFDEICGLDRTLGEFRETIFSEQSKVEDRTQMNAAEQIRLNETLDAFLIRISSKLLLKPGLKCVEWLVRRFRVHEYNTERLLLAFLPFFESPIFPLVLSIIPERNLSDPVRFLYPYIQARENPRMHAIKYTAANNRSFFRTLNGYVLEVVKSGYQFPTLLSFWTCVIVQGVDGMLDSARAGAENVRRQKQEDTLLEILPVLDAGFTLANAPDMVLACIMITTIVASKAEPGDKVVKRLMTAVAGACTPDVLDESMMCLVVLAEELESERIPKSVLKFILETDAPLQSLHRISAQSSIERLVRSCILTTLSDLEGRWIDRIIPFFQELVDSRSISLRTAGNGISLLIKFSQISERPDGNKELGPYIGRILRRIAQEPSGAELVRQCADANGLSISEIEQATHTQILFDAPQAIEMEVDPLPIEAQPSLSSAELSQRLEIVPEPNVRSFFAVGQSETFDALNSLFQQVYMDEDLLQALCEAPLFWPNDDLNHLLFITFLARIWTGAHPAPCKNAALAVGKLWMSRSATSLGNSLQVTVPYLLLALTDSSRVVREAAALFLKDLADAYTTLLSTKSSAIVAPWTFDTVYDQSQSAWSTLSIEEVSKLLNDQLLPMLEETVLDRTFVVNTFVAIFGKSSGSTHALRLKSPHLAATYSFLSSHAAATPLLDVRTKLLQFLQNPWKPGLAAHQPILQLSMRQWIQVAPADLRVEEERGLDVQALSSAYFGTLSSKDSAALRFLLELIRPASRLRPDTVTALFERLNAMWGDMNDSAKGGFANAMFDVIIADNVQTPQLAAQAHEKFHSFPIPTAVVLSLVEGLLRQSEAPSGQHRRKRARRSEGDADQSNAEVATVLKKFSFVLEYVHGSVSTLEASTGDLLGLLKALFAVLEELLALSSTIQADLVFLQVLAMDSLKMIVERLSQEHVKLDDLSSVRMDTLVNCLRKASNPQVQTTALVLVTQLAAWNPDVVLQNVMPIFTFMGDTILRQGDDFSAHVIREILRQIVPPLVVSLQKSNVGIAKGASSLLHSFTAAFEHIPSHRRLDMFESLALNLGPADSLHAIIAMFADKYPQDETVISFCSSLLSRIPANQALETIGRYTTLLADAATQQPGDWNTILAAKGKTTEELDSTMVGLLQMLDALVNNDAFRTRLKSRSKKGGKPVSGQHKVFSELLSDAIKLNQACRRNAEVSAVCGKALAGVFRLLPTGDLIKSANMLLQRSEADQEDAEILPILFRSIDAQVRRLNQSDRTSSLALVEFVPKMAAIIPTASVQSKTFAIACIDQVIRRFGKINSDAVTSAAEMIAGKDALEFPDPKVQTASLLCLASCVEVLRDDFISMAPQVMSALQQYLEVDGDQSNALFVPSYMLLVSLCEHTSFLFAGSILDRILGLVHASTTAPLTKEELEIRQYFLEVVSQRVDARELFQAIDRTMADAMTFNLEATTLQFGLLQMALQRLPNSVALKHSTVLFSSLLKAFNLRVVRHKSDNPAELQRRENLAIDVAMTTTLKVNDSVFRPFFSQMIEWASAALEGEEVSVLRWTTVFRFLEVLFGRLRSLATSYASYILEPVSKLLEVVPVNTNDGSVLVNAMMQALQKNLEHDQDDFWQAPAHFKELMNPLLDLFTRAPPTTLNEDVIPTIVELAVTAASPDHHKEINSRLIQHMRSVLVVPRLAAVKCEQALTERLGEEWLSLLAELLPVISELQEDDSETVEHETIRWIKSIEGILGEDLDAMLR